MMANRIPLIEQAGRELELLFRAARAAPDAGNLERLSVLLAAGTDWKTFLASAERHYVAPLIHRTFHDLASPYVPRKVVETLRVRTKITAWKNKRFAAELARLNQVFRASSVDVLNYKGAIAADRFYRDISRRTYNDVDFLVRREDLRRALEVLEAEGYQNTLEMNEEEGRFYESEFKEYLYVRGDYHVEPHWSITAKRYPFDLDYDGIWRRACRRAFKGADLLVMSPEDDLHVLCLVGAKGWWKRFQMVSDIAHAIAAYPDLDWSRLFDEARVAGSERIVLLSMLLAAELQGARVPDEVLGRARASRRVLRLAERIVRTFAGPKDVPRFLPGGPHILRRDLLAMRERLRDQLRYLWRTVTTPLLTHRRRFPLPRRLHWLYTLLVPAHDYLVYPAYALLRELRHGRPSPMN